ncbi:MAG: hypothetical protein U0165_12490 [Polyangiaceae bacterium]
MRSSRCCTAITLACATWLWEHVALADKIYLHDGTILEGKISEDKPGDFLTLITTKGLQKIPYKKLKKVEREPVPKTTSVTPKGDHVSLRDGTFVEGKILAEEPGESVSVETSQGIVKVPWDEVKRVVRNQSEEVLTNDRVLLRDGTIIDGDVVEENPGEYVVIRDLSGRKQTIPWTEVKRVQRVKTAPASGPGSRTIGDPTPLGETTKILDDAEKRRLAFLERGGNLLGFDTQASFLYLSLTTGGTTVTGFGVGAVAHTTYYYMSVPDPRKSQSTFVSFRAGTGIEFSGARVSVNDTTYGGYLLNFPIAVGGQVGLGSFKGPGEWKGVMLGADYKPSGSFTFITGQDSSKGFNYTGFQITADFISLHSLKEDMAKMVREAGIRTSIFVLPPIDDIPFVLYIGAGTVWY